jgi:hypothetical protein
VSPTPQSAIMPTTVRTAMALTVVAIALAVTRTVAMAAVTEVVVVALVLTLVVVVLLVASVLAFPRGHSWARLAVIVWSVITAVQSATSLVVTGVPWWYLLSAALSVACAVAIVVLLLRPSARAWFDAG